MDVTINQYLQERNIIELLFIYRYTTYGLQVVRVLLHNIYNIQYEINKS